MFFLTEQYKNGLKYMQNTVYTAQLTQIICVLVTSA